MLAKIILCLVSWVALSSATNSTSGGCKLGTQTGCSSDVAKGLTNQILDKMEAMGYSFSELNSDWIKCTDPCVNRLQSEAATHLKNAAKDKNDYITLQSAVRSSAQQYLMYIWHAAGLCGIGLAAVPGKHISDVVFEMDNFLHAI